MTIKSRIDNTFPVNKVKSVTQIALLLIFLLILFSSRIISMTAPSMELSQADSDWEIVTVDSDGGIGTSLALDSGGYPHIMYPGYGKYFHKDASGWHSALFDDNGYDVSLVIGADDYPRTCYRNFNRIDYAYQDAVGWTTDYWLGYNPNDTYTSLALDDEGYPHCTFYYDVGDYANLRYLYQDADGWHLEYVEHTYTKRQGAYNSLALDGDGNPHVSYLVGMLSGLRYAYKDGGGWHFENVDSDRVGAYTSLALDSSGYPHISYFYCGTTTDPKCDIFDLRYAYKDASGWFTQTVDAGGDVGYYTSLALDNKGYPHISYYAVEQGDLKYAHQDENGWHIETVDSAGDVGKFTSLELGKNDSVHISYYDSSNTSLKYAYLAGTTPELIFLPIVIR